MADFVKLLRVQGRLPNKLAKDITAKLKAGGLVVDFDDADGIITLAADVREVDVGLQLRDIDGTVPREIGMAINLLEDPSNLTPSSIGAVVNTTAATAGSVGLGQGQASALLLTDDAGRAIFSVRSTGAGTVYVTSAEVDISPPLDNTEAVAIIFS